MYRSAKRKGCITPYIRENFLLDTLGKARHRIPGTLDGSTGREKGYAVLVRTFLDIAQTSHILSSILRWSSLLVNGQHTRERAYDRVRSHDCRCLSQNLPLNLDYRVSIPHTVFSTFLLPIQGGDSRVPTHVQSKVFVQEIEEIFVDIKRIVRSYYSLL